ncbi:MAG: hypothetical protein V4591_08265 [Bdellovibrionota bacterium]
MQLEKIALLFPDQISTWPILSPSKALPFHINTFIKNTWGKNFSANDFNKKYLPHRFGFMTRHFQQGDPLKTISRSHLLRLNLFVTKLDVSPGRKNILVLFHSYPNMAFRSDFSKANKGQLANGICAILERIHKSLGQSFTIKTLHGEDFFSGCRQLHKYMRSYEKIYFLSDFLFNSTSSIACATEVQNTIKYFNLKKNVFIIIRDPLEKIQHNSNENYELLPFSGKMSKGLCGDAHYNSRLQQQIFAIENVIKQTQNFSMLMTSSHSLAELLETLQIIL